METWAGRLLWAEGEQICDVVAKLQGLVGPMPRDVAQLTPCALSKAVQFGCVCLLATGGGRTAIF